MAAYATRTPIVVFHPGDLDLVAGPAARRRALLDRIAFYLDPTSHDDRLTYLSALRQRQALLSSRTNDSRALDAFEVIVAQSGLRYAQAHKIAAQQLSGTAQLIFERLSSSNPTLEATLDSIADVGLEQFQCELRDRRGPDTRSSKASFGPHRDDLGLSLAGKSARHRGSQGQQRLLALALKLAELQCVRDARRTHPVLLLDDVSSELDLGRANSVFNWLTAIESQVFLTTPRIDLVRDLLLSQNDRMHFTAQDGEIRPESHN
jgi:DNA replication and repair protein RecF